MRENQSYNLLNILGLLNAAGITIVMVTHSAHDAGFAHRIVRLLDGMVAP